jgi:arylsulfatase A-like enzyme
MPRPAILAACLFLAAPSGEKKPNVVYVLCDDLGYGDVRCLNPERGRIPTPHIDRLAAGGLTFTDAHSGSSVCTPTRYGILTGRYSWRTRLQSGVLMGFSPPLIAPGRATVASLFKQHGYATGGVGKWHLGMDWPGKGEKDIDYTQPIRNGPTTLGFDYYYGISASLDMPPFIFIENDRTVGVPTVEKTWVRKGPAHKDFEAVDVLPTLARKAVEFIDRHASKPFFLYLPLNSPHTPIVPAPEWQGKSELGPYGDFVMETDWALGEVLKALDRNGVAEDTLVVFTSDNGCSPAAGVKDLEAKGHYPSHVFRGYKADIWDGGHRVPFIVRWPAVVKPGGTCSRLVCLTDLLATAADLLGAKRPDDAGEDSVSFLPLLRGEDRAVRETVIHHSISGRFAIRDERWKLDFAPGSGGWASPRDPEAVKQGLPPVQLYDMAADVGEKANLHEKHPEVVERLTKLLEKHVADGRSTPGAPQKNDAEVDVRKSGARTPGRK